MPVANGAGSAPSPWTFVLHPETWALVVALLAAYLLALRYLAPGRVNPGEPAATVRQKTWFCLGVVSLWVASDWPVDELADHYLFSAHMVQHLVYVLVTPPLLLLGMPRWLLRTMLHGKRRMKVARVLTRPFVAFVAVNLVILGIHWPAVVDLQLRSEPFHLFIHALLVGSGLMMWWPVVSPLPELASLSDPAKMLYLFLQSVLPTVPASFLTFGRVVLYPYYETAPRVFGISALTDQMISGLIMKIVGGMLLWSVIAVIFFKWYGREEREETEAVSWEDFESELEAWDLRK